MTYDMFLGGVQPMWKQRTPPFDRSEFIVSHPDQNYEWFFYGLKEIRSLPEAINGVDTH